MPEPCYLVPIQPISARKLKRKPLIYFDYHSERKDDRNLLQFNVIRLIPFSVYLTFSLKKVVVVVETFLMQLVIVALNFSKLVAERYEAVICNFSDQKQLSYRRAIVFTVSCLQSSFSAGACRHL